MKYFLSTIVFVFLLGAGFAVYVYIFPSKEIRLENAAQIVSETQMAQVEVSQTEEVQQTEVQKKDVAIEEKDNSAETNNNAAATKEASDSETKNETEKEKTKISELSEQSAKIESRLINWGFQNANGRKIKAIIIHSSYDALGSDPYAIDGLLKEYKQYGVSAHYVIDRSGKIYQLVADKNIAYHAGVSKLPDGTTDVNGASLGIELMNKEDGQYTSAQYASLNSLLSQLKSKSEIKYVLGHKDIAPGRKTDPWGFDFAKLK